jgi:hypothetical protein
MAQNGKARPLAKIALHKVFKKGNRDTLFFAGTSAGKSFLPGV